MDTRTRFLFLMSPMEYKIEKSNTGRLTHLCLPNSALHMGTNFDEHEVVQKVLNDPENYCVLLYPGKTATNLSDPTQIPTFTSQINQRRLVVILIDATWRGARKIHRLSPSLQQLPRIKFLPTTPSRYTIKKQPRPDCLSTLEATHELLLVLEKAGLDQYVQPDQLVNVFHRMQNFQIKCAADPNRRGHRHGLGKTSADSERVPEHQAL